MRQPEAELDPEPEAGSEARHDVVDRGWWVMLLVVLGTLAVVQIALELLVVLR